MKPEEDIGSLIKTKLQAAQRASKEPTWERIQHSLEERRKKRKIAFYFKVGSFMLLLLLGSLFMFTYLDIDTNNTTVSPSDIQEKVGDEKSNEVSVNHTDRKETSTNNDANNLKVNTSVDQETQLNTITKEVDGNLKNIDVSNKIKNQTKTVTSNENTSHTNSIRQITNETVLDTIVNRNDVPVTQTTQKVYYYYNSRNGQEMSSTSKKVIDSIVEINLKKRDSLKVKE